MRAAHAEGFAVVAGAITWGAWQVSYWDLNTNAFRTIEATSADAAGLPIMLGLVRPDETLPVQRAARA